MNDSNMQDDLNLVKENKMDINDFILKYKPFIYSTINKYIGKFITDEDGITTIGMMAFKEAADNYDDTKGSFYFYSRMVIKSRVIDNYRKESKFNEFESMILDDDKDSQNNTSNLERKNAFENHLINEENRFRRDEILKFTLELEKYNITLTELEKICPKKKELRIKYIKTADFIVNDKDLLDHFIKTQRLPLSEIADNMMITRKQLDRARKYIIALVVIKKGEYEYLSEYIKL